jgi:hypothetical protein
VRLCVPHREVQAVYPESRQKVRNLPVGVKAKLTNCYNHRNDLDWFLGFTRASTNFSKIVNSLPAFVEEAYFHQSASQDIIQSISNSFHPSVFGHSSLLVVHMKASSGSPKRAVMEKFSRSTPAMPLGIQLPKCPNCGEEHFLAGKFHSGKLNIECKGCNTHAEHVEVPPALVSSNIWTKRGFSLLPYPVPNPLPESLKVNWPPKISGGIKQISDPQNQRRQRNGPPLEDDVYSMVRL